MKVHNMCEFSGYVIFVSDLLCLHLRLYREDNTMQYKFIATVENLSATSRHGKT